MKTPIALLILGSIATSASAAGSDIHGFVDAQTGHTVTSEQSTSFNGYQGAFTHAGGYFGRGSAGLGHW
jgi:hypothetical protein